ncbi:hypothetical protein [Lysobacter sp. CA199]|uniref:hypothetical protein n=1 Tax=Lysobacter sp. CA199 TaxID=3455608 RepID=UPI003F8D7939
MFSLEDMPAKVSSFNPRAEKHGDDNVPAGDIKFEVNAHSSILDHFHKGLRKFLFCKPRVGDQPGLPFKDNDDLTALNIPSLKPLRLDEDFTGYELQVTTGLETSERITLKGVKLSNFAFEAINGGAVKMSFSASAHPDDKQAGRLYLLIQNEVDITLIPPKAETESSKQKDLANAA